MTANVRCCSLGLVLSRTEVLLYLLACWCFFCMVSRRICNGTIGFAIAVQHGVLLLTENEIRLFSSLHKNRFELVISARQLSSLSNANDCVDLLYSSQEKRDDLWFILGLHGKREKPSSVVKDGFIANTTVNTFIWHPSFYFYTIMR